jgi:hypothetical protein
MRIIFRYRLTAGEAETLVARLWRSLEKHGKPSPRLRVHQADDSLDLHIEFPSEEDAALIREALPPLVVEPSLPEPALTPFRQTTRMHPLTRAQVVRWRMRAEELRTTAEKFHDPSAQRALLRAAANYEKLAEDAERSLAHPPFARNDKTG